MDSDQISVPESLFLRLLRYSLARLTVSWRPRARVLMTVGRSVADLRLVLTEEPDNVDLYFNFVFKTFDSLKERKCCVGFSIADRLKINKFYITIHLHNIIFSDFQVVSCLSCCLWLCVQDSGKRCHCYTLFAHLKKLAAKFCGRKGIWEVGREKIHDGRFCLFRLLSAFV